MLTFKELENGNLMISLDEEGREYLEDHLVHKFENEYAFNKDNASLWADLSESERANGGYLLTNAEEIGAGLTDSPMFVDEVDRYDDGRIELLPQSKAWWFPEYQVVDEFKELLEKGFVIFTLATE